MTTGAKDNRGKQMHQQTNKTNHKQIANSLNTGSPKAICWRPRVTRRNVEDAWAMQSCGETEGTNNREDAKLMAGPTIILSIKICMHDKPFTMHAQNCTMQSQTRERNSMHEIDWPWRTEYQPCREPWRPFLIILSYYKS